MPTSVADRSRVKRGVFGAGRFMTEEGHDSEVGLNRDVLQTATARTPLDGPEALVVARYHANIYTGRYRLRGVAEDIAQTAILSVQETIANKKNKTKDMTPGLLTAAAKNAALAEMTRRNGLKRHEDVKAREMLDAETSFIEAVDHREATPDEINEIAERIRNEWHDPRHRPTVGFQHLHPVGLFGDTPEEALDQPVAGGAPDGRSEADLVADQVETGNVVGAEAVGRAWNALAREWGVPSVKPGTLTPDAAAYAAHNITDARQVAQRVLDGRAHPGEAAALLAPFGNLDEKAARRAIEGLATTNAGRFWTKVLEYAA